MSGLSTYAGLGVALACGLLIGLDRERQGEEGEFGGIRTFPLISLVGGLAQLAAGALGSWVVGVALAGLVAWVGVYYFNTAQKGEVGLTSEVSALAAFLCGVVALQDHLALAFAVAVAVTLVLSLKGALHRMVDQLAREDVTATLKFLVVAFVVLPLLPSKTYSILVPAGLITSVAGGQAWTLELVNPAKVGWMVVLIAGISYAGFLASKLMAAKRGLGLTAFLGGLVSSTAVTLSFSGTAKRSPELRNTCLVAILVASTTMFVRVLVEVAAVAPALVPRLARPIGAMAVAGLVACALFWFRRGEGSADSEIKLTNPFELNQALKFGAFFAGILLIAGAAKTVFGNGGLYLSGLLAGLTDVDAITLSVAQMAVHKSKPLDPGVAVTTITIAALANTVVKGIMALVTGGRELGVRVMGTFGFVTMVGVVVLLFW